MKQLPGIKLPFSQFVILKNPASTHIRLAERHIAELSQIFPKIPVRVIETGSTVAETYARLRKYKHELGAKTLLCIAGGDGTVNHVVEFLLGDSSLVEAARRTVILPFWAGNANDFAHMANGPAFRLRLSALFKDGKVTPVYPLECQLTGPDGHTTIYRAASYAGFGATAAVARELNQGEHRRRWWQRLILSKIIGEIATVGRILLGSSSFTLEENGQELLIYERSYVNGTRMGRLQPFAASLTDRIFVQTTVYKKDKHLMAFFRWLSGNMRPVPTRRANRASTFTTKDSIWMHVDGEPTRITKNTQVTVHCSRIPVYVFNMRLDRPQRTKPKKH